MAREHPRYADMEFPEYEWQEFPRMVYPGAPDQKKPYDKKGRPLKGVIVNDDAEMAAALGTVEDAPEPEFVPAAGGAERLKTAEDEKAELLEEAEVLGVQVDKRWGVAKIQDAIDAHKNDAVV